jgi:transcriptional regulator with XRE-family HTH domain
MADVESDRSLTLSPGQRFGRRLRDQREQQRITLDRIATSTKIKASLLAGLERGDVSSWPAGIFQRAFIREYARAIGLDPEPVVAEFAKVFADGKVETETQVPIAPAGELRLSLEDEPQELRSFAAPLCAGLIEAACLALLALAASWITAASFATVCTMVLLLYYPIATAFVGSTPAAWVLKRDIAIRDRQRMPDRRAPAAEMRDRLYLVKSTTEPERTDGKDEDADLNADSPARRSAAR